MLLVWGVGLAGCRFLCAGKYLAPLIEHERSGPQHPAHGGRYVSGDLVHDLANTRGHEWLATCVPVQDVLSQSTLSSSRCGEGVPGHGKLHACGFKSVDLQVPESPKLVIFGINLPPLSDFYKIWRGEGTPRPAPSCQIWGRESQVSTVIPNFTVLALKMWAYSLKNHKKSQFFV